MSMFRKRSAPAAPAYQIVERTTYFRVFTYVDPETGEEWSESRQRVIVRDIDGVLFRAYL